MSFSFAFQQQNKHLLRQREQRQSRRSSSTITTIGNRIGTSRTSSSTLSSAYGGLSLHDEEAEIINGKDQKFNAENESAEIVISQPKDLVPSANNSNPHEPVLLRDFPSSVRDIEPESFEQGSIPASSKHFVRSPHQENKNPKPVLSEQSTFCNIQSPPAWTHPVRKSIRAITSSSKKKSDNNNSDTWKAPNISFEERQQAEPSEFLTQDEGHSDCITNSDHPKLLRDFPSSSSPPPAPEISSSFAKGAGNNHRGQLQGHGTRNNRAPIRAGVRWLRSPPPLHPDKRKRLSDSSLFDCISLPVKPTNPIERGCTPTEDSTKQDSANTHSESPEKLDLEFNTFTPKKATTEKNFESISSSPDGVIDLFRDFHPNKSTGYIRPAGGETNTDKTVEAGFLTSDYEDDEVTLPPPAPVASTSPPPPIDSVTFSHTLHRSCGDECDSSVASLNASDRSTSSLSSCASEAASLTRSKTESSFQDCSTTESSELLTGRKSYPNKYFERYTMPTSDVPPSMFPATGSRENSELENALSPTKNATRLRKPASAYEGTNKDNGFVDLSKPVPLVKNDVGTALEKPIPLESRQDSYGLNTSSPIRPNVVVSAFPQKKVLKIVEDDSDLSEADEENEAASVKDGQEVCGKKSTGGSDISSMSSHDSSSSSETSEDEEEETYKNVKPTPLDGIPELPPLKDTTVETQYLILKEMRTRLIEATSMANQYQAQYKESHLSSQNLLKKVSALGAKLASQQQSDSNAKNALNEQNTEETGTSLTVDVKSGSTTPPRSQRFSLRNLRRGIKKKESSGYAPVEDHMMASSPSTPSTAVSTLPSPSRAGGSAPTSPASSSSTGLIKQNSQTSVIDNMETVVAAQKAKAEMVQRITELQRRNGMLAEKLQSLSNLYARAYHTITHLKQQHKIELDKQSEIEMQLLNQISEVADEARRKEEQYHEHLSEQSKVIENLRQKVEAIEKERQEERENPILVKLQEDFSALQSDVETLAGRNSHLNHENSEMRRQLNHNQQMIIPQLEHQLRSTETELQKMTQSLRVVCDEKALLKDSLTMSHLSKVEEMQASHNKQIEEMKEAHGLILKELQDQLRDQDNALRSMEQTMKSQKQRLMELESTSELDDIDREVSSGTGSSNHKSRTIKNVRENDASNEASSVSASATEVQHWRENCLHLQQKVAGLEKTCGQLRLSYRERDSMCRSVTQELEELQRRQSTVMVAESKQNYVSTESENSTEDKELEKDDLHMFHSAMELSSSESGSTTNDEDPTTVKLTNERTVKINDESSGDASQIRKRLDSAVSIDSIFSEEEELGGGSEHAMLNGKDSQEITTDDIVPAGSEENHDDTMHFDLPTVESRSKSMLSKMTMTGEIKSEVSSKKDDADSGSGASRTLDEDGGNALGDSTESMDQNGKDQKESDDGIIANRSSNDDASRDTDDEDSELWC